MTPEERALWKVKGWHWCIHYDGIVKRARCDAGVPFADVVTTLRIPTGQLEKRYPCCIEWGGSDSCSKREIEGQEVAGG